MDDYDPGKTFVTHMRYLEKIKDYWDTRSEGYSLQIAKEMEEKKDDFYRPYFQDMQSGSSVLDVGCGPGFFSLLLTSLGLKVTAADYSEGMLKKAKELIRKNSSKEVEFIRADAQNLPFANESFDAVVSRNLVWNLEEPEKAFSEWLRVLKPGGKLLIFDGNHYCYLFNKDYAAVQNDVEKVSNHILLDVKTNVIDEIAKDLPLSKRIRPEWDEEVLKSLGAKNVETEILIWEGEKESVPVRFVVKAEK